VVRSGARALVGKRWQRAPDPKRDERLGEREGHGHRHRRVETSAVPSVGAMQTSSSSAWPGEQAEMTMAKVSITPSAS
jgi:hypothetical protein